MFINFCPQFEYNISSVGKWNLFLVQYIAVLYCLTCRYCVLCIFSFFKMLFPMASVKGHSPVKTWYCTKYPFWDNMWIKRLAIAKLCLHHTPVYYWLLSDIDENHDIYFHSVDDLITMVTEKITKIWIKAYCVHILEKKWNGKKSGRTAIS